MKKRAKAKKRTGTSSTTKTQRVKQVVIASGRAVGRAAIKVSSKVIKVKKPREMLKGVLSVLANAGIHKVVESISISEKDDKGTVKTGDNGTPVQNVKVTSQVQGFVYVLFYVLGLASFLPKEWISSEYLEINALENGLKKFTATSKNEKIRGLTPLFQGADMIQQAASGVDYFAIQAATQNDVAENKDYFSIQGFSTPVQGVEEQYNDPFKF